MKRAFLALALFSATAAQADVMLDLTYGQRELKIEEAGEQSDEDLAEQATDMSLHAGFAFDKSRMFTLGLFATRREFALNDLFDAFGDFEMTGMVYGPEFRAALDLKKVLLFVKGQYAMGTYELTGKTEAFLGSQMKIKDEFKASGYDIGVGVDVPLGVNFGLLIGYAISEESVKLEKETVEVTGGTGTDTTTEFEAEADDTDADEEKYKYSGLVLGLGLRF